MRKRVALKIAVSPLVLGVTMVGCSTTQTSMFRPVAATAQEAQSDQQSAKNYGLAQVSAQKGDMAGALGFAEKAVEQSPRDAGYRMLLGDLYLKNGRFLSAETAFSDVLALHPDNSRARFNLALAQIALGKSYAALVQLDRLAETASAADLGLAFALAGQPDRAVAMLEPAARTEGADGRVRQNLALAYAMTGDWQRARVTASQDLSPADLQPRMEQWASFTQPKASHDQIASLLGVTPVSDTGQPVRLALLPLAPNPVAIVEAQPEPQAPVAELAAYVPEEVSVPPVQYAQAAPISVNPTVAIRSETPAASAPARPVAPVRQEQARTSSGRFVVQLGAYANARAAQQAWSHASGLYGLSGYAPVTATVTLPKGTFHRLSVAGFETQAQAARACQSIKGKGGACFVRGSAGDAPIRIASRDTRKG
ncbi:MAG: SPOR domain-containing protein [Sphingosinicella sp.]|nr:SPOR domain-containing protein [Sphingosinicella sp.]